MNPIVKIVLIVAVILLQPTLIWMFWDDSVSQIFGVRDIEFGEAVALWIVGACLFKSARG